MGTRTIELPEETIAKAEAKARKTRRTVEEVIATAVDRLREDPPPVEIVKPRDYSGQRQWLEENRVEYAGKWVALDGDKLVASGDDGHQVYLDAKKQGVKIPMVVHLEP